MTSADSSEVLTPQSERRNCATLAEVDVDRDAVGLAHLDCGKRSAADGPRSARVICAAMPNAEFVQVPDSVGHRMDPEATARIVAARIRS